MRASDGGGALVGPEPLTIVERGCLFVSGPQGLEFVRGRPCDTGTGDRRYHIKKIIKLKRRELCACMLV